MSNQGSELLKVTSSENARQQLHRTTSELPHTSKLHRHHRPHLHRRDKEEKLDRTFGSALHQSSTNEGSKSEWVTPNSSHNASRRTSLLTSADDFLARVDSKREKKIVKEGEVKAESEKNISRAIELRESLLALNTLSNNTTSRLDNTYYSILEKLSALNDIITSLKELTLMTRKLNDDFTQESSSVVTEIGTQLDAFEDFTRQEQKIENLERRISVGREKAQILAHRVETTKQKIERWEKVEGEWQQRTRKRLKFIWGITAFILMALAGLILFQYAPARTQGPGVLRGFNVSNTTMNLSEMESRLKNETLGLKRSTNSPLEKLRLPPEEKIEDDPRLRAFDEL